MASDGYTGPRWIRTAGDPPGLVKDGRTGVYYVRRSFSPGPGHKPRQKTRSLETKSRSEALKRFDVVSAQVRLDIEGRRARPRTLKEDVEFWRRVREAGTTAADVAYDDEIARRLGPEIGLDVDEAGQEFPVYDPAREAATLAFTGLVDGVRVPVEFYVEDFIKQTGKALRYGYRIRRAVAQLAQWLPTVPLTAFRAKPPRSPGGKVTHPKGNDLAAVDRRIASDFTAHLATSEASPKTARAKLSALSNYWAWLASRGEVEENVWLGHRLPKAAAKADVRAYTRDEMAALLKGPAPQPLADFIRVAALTGMRESEIGALRVRDCADGWFTIHRGKTEAAKRRLPTHSGLASIVGRRTAGKKGDEYLFDDLPKSDGLGRGRHEKVGQQFTKYRRRAGVDDRREDGRSRVDFHSFRRWFITEAVRHSGEPEWAVAEIVGHAIPPQGMTIEKYYGGSLPEKLQKIVEAVRLPDAG